VLKARAGLPMTEEEHNEWVQAFKDIEESIEEMDLREEKENPNAKYLRMKQQDLF
jgi:desulfoferrodoxin (superoxide reductase-like protein)